jgi:hypothetical protein
LTSSSCCFYGVVTSGVSFLVTLTVKLSLPEASPADRGFKWWMVLLPAWAALAVGCTGPVFRLYDDTVV